MRVEFNIQPETFAFEAEADEFEAWQAEGQGPWQQEQNRGGADYIRWVQSALNQILGLKLAVDGRMGPQTRSAIRSFQQKQGLMVDGVVGPQTEAALIAVGASSPQGTIPTRPVVRPCPKLPVSFVIDGYAKNQRDLRPDQRTNLIPIVSTMLRSLHQGCKHVRRITITGHASTEGSASYNERLSRKRAEMVQKDIDSALGILSIIVASPIKFVIKSRGESEPLVQESTESDRRRNRRVEIVLDS